MNSALSANLVDEGSASEVTTETGAEPEGFWRRGDGLAIDAPPATRRFEPRGSSVEHRERH